MTQIVLSIQERKALRAEAHHLNPVVIIGNEGLSAAVIKEVDHALSAHGLIKVRAGSDERAQRETWLLQLTEELSAAPIQHIGKLLIIWRPPQAKDKTADEDRMAGPKEFKVLKYSKRGGQRPEVKRVTVLGNQRLTAGGKVKRADAKRVSVKKRAQSKD